MTSQPTHRRATPRQIHACPPFAGIFTQSDERLRLLAPSHEEKPIATLASPPSVRHGKHLARARLAKEPSTAERWVVAALLLWLLVGPRIELAAGARVEDLVFAALAVLCLLHSRLVVRPASPSIAIACVAVAGLISAVVATARGMVAPVPAALYAVRPLEYWIAFPAALLLLRGTHSLWSRRIELLLAVVTVLQTAFAVMQYYFGLQVGFSHAAYTRAAGLTVGPYELGAITAMLVVYWVSRGRFTMASLAAIALAASISRVSILGAVAALVVLIGIWAVRQVLVVHRVGLRAAFPLPAHGRLRVAGQLLSVAAAVLVLAFTLGLVHLPAAQLPRAAPAPTAAAATVAPGEVPSASPPAPAEGGTGAPPDSAAERIATTSIQGSWALGGRLAAVVPPVDTSAKYANVAYTRLNQFVNLNTAAQQGAEASNLVRFFRWHLILNTIDDPADIAFGLGPSFVGPSVDGSYLRMLADGGVLGVLAWLALIFTWLRRTPLWMRCVTISLLVGALFIDIVYAQRPMVLFWILMATAFMARNADPDAPAERQRTGAAA